MQRSLLVLLLCISLPAMADYSTPGTFVKWTLDDLVTNSSGNVTYSNGEYSVSGVITITANDTLQITNDAVVKFAASTHFLVNGTIIINPPNNVLFTAADQATGFNGMRLDGSTASSLKKLTLEYAVSLNLRDCSPPIDSCIFQYNNVGTSTTFGNGAISVFRCNSSITNSQFLNNRRAAIQGGANISNAPKIINCLFSGNNTTNQNVPQINMGATGSDTIKIINNQILAASTNSGGIGFLPTGTANILITGNAIKNNRYGISLNGGSLVNAMVSYNIIDSNNVQGNPNLGGSGIAFAGGSSTSHQNTIVTGNIIRWNLWGITIQGGAKPNLGDLSNADTSDNGKNWFVGNTNATTPGIHLYNNSPDDIMAQGNYWGSNDATDIENSIFHKTDNTSLGLVNYSNYVLPVKLLSFTASLKDKSVRLQWKTENEINASHFEIEKSKNGTSFNRIGVMSANNRTTLSIYNFTDASFSNNAYYRIKMIDKDERFEYSSTIFIKHDDKNFDVQLYPTIISDNKKLNLVFRTEKNQKLQIVFSDVNGKLIRASTYSAVAGENHIILTNIPFVKGVLFVKISSEDQSKVIPIIKY